MKLSLRILLINFAIVVLILLSTTIVLYTAFYNSLYSQQNKYLKNSANNFGYLFGEFSQQIENNFLNIKNTKNLNNFAASDLTFIDFILSGKNDSSQLRFLFKNQIVVDKGDFTSLNLFKENNPSCIIKKHVENNITYYYGKILEENDLNRFAQTINYEIAFIYKDIPFLISNTASNEGYFSYLKNGYDNLKFSKNYSIYSNEEVNDELIMIKYNINTSNHSLSFIIFNDLKEISSLKSYIKIITIFIGIGGVILSLILTLLFTTKIRKNISLFASATEETKKGNLKTKIELNTKDELGELASAFNIMLDELSKNQKATNEYADFITLINQNASLKEVSEAVLKKVTSTCNFTIGALYLLQDNDVKLISSYGLKKTFFEKDLYEFMKPAIDNCEIKEITFNEDPPIISTGTLEIKIKYLLFLPIVFNNTTIGLLELGATDKPTEEAKSYLSKIQEQLATGIVNAKAFLQLENLVDELKRLNEDYQEQNLQIKSQNDILTELHKKLKEKAEELEVQKELAEESTKLKSQFLANVSHELRTPLNSVLGLTELILNDNVLSMKNKERLEIVQKNGKRLLSLLNNILDYSKMEAGKSDLKIDRVVINEIIVDIEDYISPLLYKKEVEFKIVSEIPRNEIVKIDKSKVNQVLINLLSNAVKFTDCGEIELKLFVEENKLCFSVKDTGIGIQEEDQEKIFEEFRQLDGSTSRRYGGTGLGLTISKKVAELINGTLTMNSVKNKGSEFTLKIPYESLGFDEALEIKIDAPSKKYSTFVEEDKLFYKGNVLIVDDDPDTLYTLNELVQSFECKTYLASNGMEALKLVEEKKPDLILLDIMMPEMDGFTTLNKIRNIEGFKTVPVYAITAKAMIEDKEIILRNGFDDYLTKPINSSILAFKLNKVLQEV